MILPRMYYIQQHFPRPILPDVAQAVSDELRSKGLLKLLHSGQHIAITAGSRGIANIATILRTVVDLVREAGAIPVIIPAMGSHGGGTAQGQHEMLRGLGISEEKVGAPIVSSTDVVEVGRTAGGEPVYLDAIAAAADGIIVVNRVKAHTSFHGRYESGLVKMLVVGLGKPKGAEAFHRHTRDLAAELVARGQVILARARVLIGLAIIENSYEETARVVALRPEEFLSVEPELLKEAKSLMPRLPVTRLDLLIVDFMGKNFAGTGMDTNIIGRLGIYGVPDPGDPVIERIAVLDLSQESHGNANGIGLADFTTRRLVNKIDFHATYLNTLTATFVQRAKIPITLGSDYDVITAALKSLGDVEPERARVIRIHNTLELEKMWVSERVYEEIKDNQRVVLLSGPSEMRFDGEGNIISW